MHFIRKNVLSVGGKAKKLSKKIYLYYQENDNKRKKNMKNAESNDTEIRLLSGFPFSKSRIAAGNLSPFEQKSREDLRLLMHTVKNKYPGVSFIWHSFAPRFGIQSSAELIFGVQGQTGRYTARVESERMEDGTELRRVVDNYYGARISAELEKRVRAVTGAASVQARITSLRGIEFDGTITLQELLTSGRLPESVIVLTASPEQMKKTLPDEWRTQLTSAGIPGFYQIYINCKTASPDQMYCGSFRVSARGNRRA